MISYLSAWSFYVRWFNMSYSKLHVNTGVPQGSSLRPLCFSLFLCCHMCSVPSASDTINMQTTHKCTSRRPKSDKVDVLQQCTVAVRHCLLSNGLQLNPSKSDVIQFITGRGRERVDDVTSIQILDTTIQPSSTLKSLGVTLDKQLSFDQHS